MSESYKSGSVRGVRSNAHPYRDKGCAEHVQQLGGASPLPILMVEKVSSWSGQAGPESSVEQNRGPMDKNRI